jgi:hypothetical protein
LRHHLELHRRQLAEYQEQTQRVLDQAAQPQGLEGEKLYWHLTLRAGVLNEQFWIQWCEEAIDRIERLGQVAPAVFEQEDVGG